MNSAEDKIIRASNRVYLKPQDPRVKASQQSANISKVRKWGEVHAVPLTVHPGLQGMVRKKTILEEECINQKRLWCVSPKVDVFPKDLC